MKRLRVSTGMSGSSSHVVSCLFTTFGCYYHCWSSFHLSKEFAAFNILGPIFSLTIYWSTSRNLISIRAYNSKIIVVYATQNTIISSNFLVWKFCGKAKFPPETMRKLCLSTKFPHQEIR